MYIKEIKDMINLMNENGLTELEIEKEGVRIKLRKGSSGYEKAIEYVSHPQPHGAAVPAAQAVRHASHPIWPVPRRGETRIGACLHE